MSGEFRYTNKGIKAAGYGILLLSLILIGIDVAVGLKPVGMCGMAFFGIGLYVLLSMKVPCSYCVKGGELEFRLLLVRRRIKLGEIIAADSRSIGEDGSCGIMTLVIRTKKRSYTLREIIGRGELLPSNTALARLGRYLNMRIEGAAACLESFT